jgi:hypothetical protein
MSSQLEEYTSATKRLKQTFDNKENREFERDVSKSGLTLPFHKYEGPGNSVNLGEPSNVADAISQLHDTEYFDATHKYNYGQTSRDEFNKAIQDSDTEAIKNFAKTPSIGGVLGTVGLGAKKFAENFTNNPIYPNPGKQTLIWMIWLLHLLFLRRNDRHLNVTIVVILVHHHLKLVYQVLSTN